MPKDIPTKMFSPFIKAILVLSVACVIFLASTKSLLYYRLLAILLVAFLSHQSECVACMRQFLLMQHDRDRNVFKNRD